MPKNIMILPEDIRRQGAIENDPIPINQYQTPFTDEVERYGSEHLVRIQRDMFIIRTFENHILEVSLRGNYKGVEYSHRGPAHLSIGQESAAVGQAFLLGLDDYILGGHRSHGESLAKGLSAIEKLSDDELQRIMEGHFNGACLRVVERFSHAESVRELAVDFLIYGAMAEIYHRQTGLNRGLGGSMHAYFTPFGIYPNNAIVGASADIAVGAALFKRINHRPGLVVCNIGDGAVGCGPVWESLVFSSMDQFRTLWDGQHRGGLPFMLNVMNNFYAMGGQHLGETMGFKMMARIGSGVNPEQMHAERIDGYNPLAVIDAVRRKREVIERGEGPVLLETVAYRFCGHSSYDPGSYREREEIEAWRPFDPLTTWAQQIIDHNLTTSDELKTMEQQIEERMFAAYRHAIDLEISPREEITPEGGLRASLMFSNQRIESLDPTRTPDVRIPIDENPRVKDLARRSRSGLGTHGEQLPKSACIQMRDAIFEAILERAYTDPTLIFYGEENRDWGGAFAVYRGLTESLPYHRLFNTPILEGAIIGTAVGYALSGGRALVELMYGDFLGRCGDQAFNQMAKWQAMSGGLLRIPMVVRLMVGSMYGAQHSQDWSSICAHVPGLKVLYPATPYDAKGLMKTALMGTDPVFFFECQRLYDMPELFHEGGVPLESYELPIGEPDVKREGQDLTILTVGPTLYRALEAAERFEKEFGISCELIDARSIVPFNYEKVLESVRKTHRILLASDACDRGSIIHTFASKINQYVYDELDAPPVVIGARNWVVPAYEVEDRYIPNPNDFLDAYHEHVEPLKGYKPAGRRDVTDDMRRSAEGV